jgi:polyisoprenoid-binding protein YceI
MNNIKLLIGTAAILLASAFTIIGSVNWKVKEDYSVKFSGGHVQGLFKGLKATILFDEGNPEKSKVMAYIDTRTINTGNGEMNAHAKEALAVDKFPLITFESTAVTKISSGYEAAGNLTMKGITKKVKIPFIFDSKKKASNQFPFVDKEVFSGVFTIVPKDFNVTRLGTPGEITIELTIPVTQ